MRPTTLALTLTLLLAAGGTTDAQDKEAEAAGRRYLEKVAKVWRAEAPFETLVGLYTGSAWVGYHRYRIERAPEGSGAAFVVTHRMRIQAPLPARVFESRAFLDERLCILQSEVDARPGGGARVTLRWQHGRVETILDLAGKLSTSTVALESPPAWSSVFLGFTALPEDERLELTEFAPERGGMFRATLQRLPPPSPRRPAEARRRALSPATSSGVIGKCTTGCATKAARSLRCRP